MNSNNSLKVNVSVKNRKTEGKRMGRVGRDNLYQAAVQWSLGGLPWQCGLAVLCSCEARFCGTFILNSAIS